MSKQPTVDFVIPCYNEADNIAALVSEFQTAFADSNFSWRLIMVDDGSSDGTWDAIQRVAESDHVAAIRFSRNFGKESAIYAGLSASDADYAGIIDADLQQKPTTARDMLEKLVATPDADCVAAYQEHRKDGAFMSFLKRRFYSVFQHTTESNAIANASDFRVFTAQVRDAVLSMREYYRFSKGIFAWVGFNTIPYPYTPDSRANGESKWGFGSLFRYAVEGLLSFTTEPLHLITKIGALICVAALAYALFIVIRTLVMGVDWPGFATTVTLILFLGGMQFFAIGIIGEYLARAYVQGKERPIYIEKSRIGLDNASTDPSANGQNDA